MDSRHHDLAVERIFADPDDEVLPIALENFGSGDEEGIAFVTIGLDLFPRRFPDGVALSRRARLVAPQLMTFQQDAVDGDDLARFKQDDVADPDFVHVEQALVAGPDDLDVALFFLGVEFAELALLLPVVERTDQCDDGNGDHCDPKERFGPGTYFDGKTGRLTDSTALDPVDLGLLDLVAVLVLIILWRRAKCRVEPKRQTDGSRDEKQDCCDRFTLSALPPKVPGEDVLRTLSCMAIHISKNKLLLFLCGIRFSPYTSPRFSQFSPPSCSPCFLSTCRPFNNPSGPPSSVRVSSDFGSTSELSLRGEKVKGAISDAGGSGSAAAWRAARRAAIIGSASSSSGSGLGSSSSLSLPRRVMRCHSVRFFAGLLVAGSGRALGPAAVAVATAPSSCSLSSPTVSGTPRLLVAPTLP